MQEAVPKGEGGMLQYLVQKLKNIEKIITRK